jgi:hypothetical protein
VPVCPRCHDEYRDGVVECATCGVPLAPDAAPLPPRVDRLLGTFHPVVAERVLTMLGRRRILHDTVAADGRVEIIVDRRFRDDLRAELAVNWSQIVGNLDADAMYEVLASGGTQPGWFDAPTSSWVDREGRLQVDPGDDEEAMADAGRLWGPTLVAIGAVVGLFGWYGQDSVALLLLGIVMVVVGLLLPL